MSENYESKVEEQNNTTTIDPFTPVQSDSNDNWSQYKRYFKILELDSDCDARQALAAYTKLKSLFSSSVQTAMYSIDSMSSSLLELDEAYSKVKEYLDKKTSSSLKNNSPFAGVVSKFIPEFPTDTTSFTQETLPLSSIDQNTTQSSLNSSNYNDVDETNESNNSLDFQSSATLTSFHQTQNSTVDYSQIEKILSESDPGSGSTFKKIREAQGISLDDVQIKTKILIHNLQAIEEENFSAFIALVFLKGFVKAYLKAIHVNNDTSYNLFIKKAELYFSKK